VVRTDNSVAGAGDVVGIRTSGDTSPVPLLASRFTEKNPAVSPEGKWLAYASNESGRDEVYVRPFPNTNDGRWQISTAGGAQPRWSPDGRTLYFLDPTSRMIAVGVTTGALFAVGESKPLFDASGFTLEAFHQAYDLTPDGRFFLFLAPRRTADGSATPHLVRVDHWFRDIEAKLAE
jgi:serine/threonine-protein kinase